MGSLSRASPGADRVVKACLFTDPEPRVDSGILSRPTNDDRGVKNLPKRLGVTEGFRRSLLRTDRVGERKALVGTDRVGERKELAGEEVKAIGGLEGTSSVDGPK